MRALAQALLADRQVRLVDEEGRPLTEQASLLDPLEQMTCPYPGPRLGKPMNRAALAQVGRHWSRLLEEVRLEMPAEGRLQQAFQLSLEMVCAPLLADEAVLPVYVAVRYKACVGFCQVFAWLLLEQGDQPLADMGTGEEFASWIEGAGWLEGERQVCAGSAGQIAALFTAFRDGSGGGLSCSAVLEIVALQAALALSSYAGLRQEPPDESLGCRLLASGRAPWLYAVTSRPGLAADSALRLLAGGGQRVRRFLAGQPEKLSHSAREALFWECLS